MQPFNIVALEFANIDIDANIVHKGSKSMAILMDSIENLFDLRRHEIRCSQFHDNYSAIQVSRFADIRRKVAHHFNSRFACRYVQRNFGTQPIMQSYPHHPLEFDYFTDQRDQHGKRSEKNGQNANENVAHTGEIGLRNRAWILHF